MDSPTPKQLPKSDDFLIEDVFPHPDIHIFAGPSGGGKTTLLTQMLQTWSQGGTWFGHQCYPRPFAYISGERTTKGVSRTLNRLGISPESFAIVGSTELAKGCTLATAVNAALKKRPDAQVFIVEGLTRFIPGGKISDAHVVINFLVDLQRLCESKEITFLLVTWSPKEKEGERYINPRQRAMGSVAFAGCSETIVLIEPYGEEGTRAVSILKKNSRDEYYYMDFSGPNGMLRQIAAPGEQVRNASTYVLAFDDGFTFSPNDLEDAFPELDRGAIKRTLRSLLHEREIARVCRGRYRRTRAIPLPELPPGVSPNALVVPSEG
jgi:archaellum biogenesis ATPase FlaH